MNYAWNSLIYTYLHYFYNLEKLPVFYIVSGLSPLQTYPLCIYARSASAVRTLIVMNFFQNPALQVLWELVFLSCHPPGNIILSTPKVQLKLIKINPNLILKGKGRPSGVFRVVLCTASVSSLCWGRGLGVCCCFLFLHCFGVSLITFFLLFLEWSSDDQHIYMHSHGILLWFLQSQLACKFSALPAMPVVKSCSFSCFSVKQKSYTNWPLLTEDCIFQTNQKWTWLTPLSDLSLVVNWHNLIEHFKE